MPDGASPLANQNQGVLLVGGSNNAIGGVNPGQGNVIAYNPKGAVYVDGGQGNPILSNSIFGNTGGIHLEPGANGNEKAPALVSGLLAGGTLQLKVYLYPRPGRFTVQVFANPSCGASGPQGQTLLKSATVTAGTLVSLTMAGPPAGQRQLTATATDANNNTSTFSTCLAVP